MGISSHLHDISGAAPLPLLLLASLASTLASVFSVPGACRTPSSATASIISSSLATLAALADNLAASSVSTVAAGRAAGECTVCLSAMAEGDRVRMLACHHAFHVACLAGWLDQTHLSCPLYRASPAAREDVGRRAGEDAVSWFTRF